MTHTANVNHYEGVWKNEDLCVGFNFSWLVVLQNQTYYWKKQNLGA